LKPVVPTVTTCIIAIVNELLNRSVLPRSPDKVRTKGLLK